MSRHFCLDQPNTRQKISSWLLHQWHGRNVTYELRLSLFPAFGELVKSSSLKNRIRTKKLTSLLSWAFQMYFLQHATKFCKGSKLLITVISLFLFCRWLEESQILWHISAWSQNTLLATSTQKCCHGKYLFHPLNPMRRSVIPVFFSKTPSQKS